MSTFDPAALAEFDQSQARVRDAVDALLEGLVRGAGRCPCGEPMDAPRHTLVLTDYISAQCDPDTLPLLLAEAITRLALGGGAK